MEWKPRDTIIITVNEKPDEAQALIQKLCLVEDKHKSRDISVAFARERNERRLREMEKSGTASLLRGRGTTGIQVFGEKGVPNGELGKLFKDARELKFKFVDASWHQEPMWDRQSGLIAFDYVAGNEIVVMKTTIDFVLERKPDSKRWDEELLRDIIKYFRRRPFRHVYPWKNPTGVDMIECACGNDLEVGTFRRIRLNEAGEYYLEEIKNERHLKLVRSA